ncbi:molybdopterin molybdotransferase MoeA [Halalkalibacterium halodurans]|uniref:Molybdopterin molybdenumtransferase n=1 Tax=Halalkalibacterium halodurans (strain ATCC BAA-125 / DSM 18197 / FERM 7344 / JCM 9153 / C-125) TaxID=272558 RepID=Q9K8I5_HALH5|nr:gephyrin-like molybdotransferase Glp [Halalkalibacterium halodurans]MDY7223566.1 gephyrin-like molybdotransferase Glp [Halalkalibacterium halodurans]MDY7242787.1 gephyrin-like molybdotransferase Glp [Halalkalibacterium halodurans]MED4082227.1 molybdopterin molybdotransferase MoeA [Halalkalibacterium halodurans]MED4084534.1 molybdopterin molybdotransferase MoeA [Halalkalibacterium halodurans]MED4110196.1 molybdopterin molybdotransferase MoeA [Halalkalibacterium halodurans]
MVERRVPIPVHEAVEQVVAFAKERAMEWVPLEEADGRFLAQPLVADHNVPPFDKSPLDGFAIRAVDTEDATRETPVRLKIIEEIGAGQVAQKVPSQGEAIRIMTGAQMPEGTDAVVMFELTKEISEAGESFIEVKRSFQPGDNISFCGEDAKEGTPLVEKGRQIDAGIKALLATFGYAKVPVYKMPKIGIFATGTELLEVDEPLVPGKIRNSNAYMVASQVKQIGAEPVYLGKLVDDFDQCYDAIATALADVDVLVTTGGVSVGDYDYLPAIYEKLGANVLFNKIAMRPGSVTTVAEREGQLLFGLSGNPSACFVGFELLVRPFIHVGFCSEQPFLKRVKATLGRDFPKPNPFTRFVRSQVEFKIDRLIVKPTGLDKSGVVTSLANANGLLMLPGGTRGFQAGDEVDVLLLKGEGGPMPLSEA